MENAYQPELWRDLYVMLGTSSAALIGLLFVVTSLHLDDIVKNPVFHMRAYNQTLYLLILISEAMLVLIPQPALILGTEMVAVNLLGLCLPSKNIYNFFYKNKEISHSGGWSMSRAIRYIVAFLLGIAGGAALIKLSNWGMYLVTASCAILLFTVILNAWTLMLGVGQMDKRKR